MPKHIFPPPPLADGSGWVEVTSDDLFQSSPAYTSRNGHFTLIGPHPDEPEAPDVALFYNDGDIQTFARVSTAIATANHLMANGGIDEECALNMDERVAPMATPARTQEEGQWAGDLTGYLLGMGWTTLNLKIRTMLFGKYTDIVDIVRYETVVFKHEDAPIEFVITESGENGYTVLARHGTGHFTSAYISADEGSFAVTLENAMKAEIDYETKRYNR